MHDSDSGIGIDFGIIPFLTGIGIKHLENSWNRNPNQAFRVSLESESRHCRNRASMFATTKTDSSIVGVISLQDVF